mmetsp:Transcript_17713/g.46315  ORF Transcript_17713/g.46315 Transcript_17713/m.46315 type:complete len:329 (+) Transcript_17713:987-1973(+)
MRSRSFTTCLSSSAVSSVERALGAPPSLSSSANVSPNTFSPRNLCVTVSTILTRASLSPVDSTRSVSSRFQLAIVLSRSRSCIRTFLTSSVAFSSSLDFASRSLPARFLSSNSFTSTSYTLEIWLSSRSTWAARGWRSECIWLSLESSTLRKLSSMECSELSSETCFSLLTKSFCFSSISPPSLSRSLCSTSLLRLVSAICSSVARWWRVISSVFFSTCTILVSWICTSARSLLVMWRWAWSSSVAIVRSCSTSDSYSLSCCVSTIRCIDISYRHSSMVRSDMELCSFCTFSALACAARISRSWSLFCWSRAVRQAALRSSIAFLSMS